MEGRELGLASVPRGEQILYLTTQLLWKQLGQTRRAQVDEWAPLGPRPGQGEGCRGELCFLLCAPQQVRGPL